MPQNLTQKDQSRSVLLRTLQLPTNTRAIIILDIADRAIHTFLIEAGKHLDIHFIVNWDISQMEACDACITDGRGSMDLVNLMKHSIVPIVPRIHPLILSLREFDPMKFEGNAFIYESENPYLIFEKLIRYLENVRYVGDKRTLLNNVGKTF